MRAIVLLLVTLSLTLGCSSHRLIRRVQAYRAVAAAGDTTREATFLTPDARMWFEKKEGEGVPLRAGGDARYAHWDEFFHGKTTYSDWRVRNGAVTALVHETNDFYELLEWRPKPYRLTWWFDDAGRIREVLLQSVPGKAESRLEEFRAWASLKHPEELEYLMPKGRIDPTGDRAGRFKKLLLEWRAQR